jgi:hypothetical protein
MGRPSIGALGARYWAEAMSMWMWRRLRDLLGESLLELSPSESEEIN